MAKRRASRPWQRRRRRRRRRRRNDDAAVFEKLSASQLKVKEEAEPRHD
jgi:hypothetical protein